MSPPPPLGFPISLARFGHMGGWPYELTASATIPPPDPGFLPYGDGDALIASVAPWAVYFFLDGSYSGIEGMLCSDGTTILSSALGVDYIMSTSGTWTARMGGDDFTGAGFDQTAPVSKPWATNPSWGGAGDYGNDVGYVTATGGFTFNVNVQPIDYAAEVGTTPYDSESFYVTSTVVAIGGMEKWTAGVLTIENAQGVNKNVISNGDAETAIFPESVPSSAIAIDNGGKYYGGYGAILVAAGYSSPGYFAVGPLSRQDSTNSGVTVFTRFSYNGGWIFSDTGILPVVYP